VIISTVYLLVCCLLGCLTVLTRRHLSKDAELLVTPATANTLEHPPPGSCELRSWSCGRQWEGRAAHRRTAGEDNTAEFRPPRATASGTENFGANLTWTAGRAEAPA
jgi:hypothetical protein